MFAWFSLNNLKVNASKCHLFFPPYQLVPVIIRLSECGPTLDLHPQNVDLKLQL